MTPLDMMNLMSLVSVLADRVQELPNDSANQKNIVEKLEGVAHAADILSIAAKRYAAASKQSATPELTNSQTENLQTNQQEGA